MIPIGLSAKPLNNSRLSKISPLNRARGVCKGSDSNSEFESDPSWSNLIVIPDIINRGSILSVIPRQAKSILRVKSRIWLVMERATLLGPSSLLAF